MLGTGNVCTGGKRLYGLTKIAVPPVEQALCAHDLRTPQRMVVTVKKRHRFVHQILSGV